MGFHHLARPGNDQGIFRHILRDHRTSCYRHPCPQGHRCDQNAIGSQFTAIPNHRRVFVPPVKIGRNRACTHIHLRSYLGIS